jgi:hypothetical protein
MEQRILANISILVVRDLGHRDKFLGGGEEHIAIITEISVKCIYIGYIRSVYSGARCTVFCLWQEFDLATQAWDTRDEQKRLLLSGLCLPEQYRFSSP